MSKNTTRPESPLARLLKFFRSYLAPSQKQKTKADESTAAPLFRADEPTAKPEPGQPVFVVWDAIGDGRVVGVFDNEELARSLLSVNPHYYRYYRCRFGQPTDDAVAWLDQAGREHINNIMQLQSTFRLSLDQSDHLCAGDGHIRKADIEDIPAMVEIWLSASIRAHNFISSDFWHKNAIEMRDRYLPASENWVYCENERILGFVALQQNTLAALFVTPGHQGRGIGRQLLNHAKTLRRMLSLTVYEANTKAIEFYSHHGFKMMIAQKDPHTGHSELLMSYP